MNYKVILSIIITIIVITLIYYKFFRLTSDHHKLTMIIPFVYISSYESANNYELLKNHNIQTIMTILPCDSKSRPMTKYDNVNYFCISKNDSVDERINDIFDITFDIINKSINDKKNILIHCFAGVSRSPTIVCAYLMKKYKLSYNDAINIIKNKRNVVKPNKGFERQLIDYENVIY